MVCLPLPPHRAIYSYLERRLYDDGTTLQRLVVLHALFA